MQYSNPIIKGFHPDPSVCRVGKDYFLVTSSFEYFPGIPLFHSNDLVHWEQIGHCLTRESQVHLTPNAPNCLGIYAPTIRYHQGRFYVVTTNVGGNAINGGNIIIWTDHIRGEWSEPLCLDLPGIDPSLFFDEDGRVYYTGTHNGVYFCEIDVATGEKLTDIHYIWSGTGGADIEAPHLYKVNGYYYLLVAEGGTSVEHMITIARSRTIEGPYESCPHNPVLTNRSLPLPIKAVGHGDLIEAHDGSWWAVCLGIRPVPYPFRHHMGRETFLTSFQWDADGWPVFANNGSLGLIMEGPCLPEVTYPKKLSRDSFMGAQLSFEWNYLFNPDMNLFVRKEEEEGILLLGNENSMDDKATSAWLGRRQEDLDCVVKTKVTFAAQDEQEEAGLTVFMNYAHHYEVALGREEGKSLIIFRRRIGSLWKIENKIPYEADTVILEIVASPNTYDFYYYDEQLQRVFVGSGEVQYLTTEAGGTFTGNYFGIYATGRGKKCKEPARFHWFDYLE